MAGGNLGNLWYELDIKDNSQARLQNIIKGIEAQLASAGKKGVTIGGVKIDPKAGQELVSKLRNILQNSGGLKIDKLDVGKALRLQIDTKNIQEQLERHTFRGKLALDVNPTELQAAVSRALRGIPSVSASQLINIGGSAASVNSTTDAVRNLNKQMGETSAIGKKVQSVLTQAFSVYAVKGFLSEVINIGGELEKQRLAMGNILGDMYEANELTKKIANLSMISPFTVQELTKATRLLTAYGVEYNEVYDITKRLSDIAAGVGVGFERIAYAFGHITSMGNLDARTLRMFQNMGVPLLQKLSDYYQQTQGKTFSTAQVRKMITDRQVSSSDVINVLKQMTDAGGQFYQMQEVMAESLATKWANLANAWNLMLGSMAEDPAIGGNLKSLAEVLTSMTQNWKNVRAAMIPVAGYLLAIKANSLMAASAVTTEMAANQKSILAMKAKRAEYLQTKVAGWELVAANRELVATVGTLTVADYKRALKTGMITKEMIAQVIASKQLSLQDSILVGKMAGMSAATSRLVYNFGALGMAAKAFATTLKGIAMNPMTWIFAATEVFMQVRQNSENEAEKIKENIDSLKQKSAEGAKNIKEALKSTEIPDSSRATLGDYKKKINDIKETLKEYDPLYQKTFRDVDAVDGQGKAVHTLQEQYEMLRKRLLGVKDAYEGIYDMSSVPTDLNSKTGDGWFDKTYSETAESYQKALDGVNSYVNKLMADKDKLEDTYKIVFNNIEVAMSKTGGESLKKWQAMKKELEGMATTADKLRHILTSEGRGGFNSNTTGIMGTDFQIIEKLFSASQGLKIRTQELGESLRNYLESEGLKYGTEGWEMKAKMIMDSIMNLTSLPENAKLALEKGFFTTTGIIKWVDEGEVPNPNPYSGGNTFQNRQYDAIDVLVKKGEGVLTEAEKESRQKAATTIKDIVKNGEDSVDTIEKMQSHIETLRKDIKQLEKADDDESKKQKERLKYELQYAEAAAKAAKYSTDKPKSNTGGSGADKIKQGFQEEIDLAKEAYAEYKKWHDLLNNEKEATAKVGENPLFKNADGSAMFDNPKDIRGNYEAILEKIGERYPDLQRKLLGAIFDFDYDQAKDNAAKAVSEMKEQIDRDTKNWNLYQKLFDATGAKEWAWKMARTTHQIWDEMTLKWADDIKANMTEKGLGDKVVDWTMTEEKAKEFFGENGDLLELFLRTKKQIEQNGIDVMTDSAEFLKSIQTLDEKLNAINGKYSSLMGVELGEEKYIKAPILNEDATEEQRAQYEKQMAIYRAYLNAVKSVVSEIQEQNIFGRSKSGDNKFRSRSEWAVMLKDITKQLQSIESVKDGNGNVVGWIGTDEFGNKVEKNAEEIRQLYEIYRKLLGLSTKSGSKDPIIHFVQGLKSLKQARETANLTGSQEDYDAWSEKLNEIGAECFQLAGDIAAIGDAWADAFSDDNTKAAIKGIKTIASMAKDLVSGNYLGAVVSLSNTIAGAFAEDEAMEMKLDLAMNDSRLKALTESIDALNESVTISNTLEQAKLGYDNAKDEISKLGEDLRGQFEFALMAFRHNKGLFDDIVQDAFNGKSVSQVRESIQQIFDSSGVDVKLRPILEEGKESSYGLLLQLLSLEPKELELVKLNPEAWKAINMLFTVLDEGSESSNIPLMEALENYLELAGKMEDLEENMQDRVLGITFKDMSDSFLDALMDMDKSADDFWNDFAKYMAKASLKNFFSTNISPSLEKKYNEMLAEVNANGGRLDKARTDYWKQQIAEEYEKGKSELEVIANAIDYNPSQNDTSSSVATGIKSITEQTADLLASYVNGIRADVSVSRSILESLDLPSLNAVAASQLAQLNMIAANTEAIMRSNESILDRVEIIEGNLSAVVNGTKRIYIQ